MVCMKEIEDFRRMINSLDPVRLSLKKEMLESAEQLCKEDEKHIDLAEELRGVAELIKLFPLTEIKALLAEAKALKGKGRRSDELDIYN